MSEKSILDLAGEFTQEAYKAALAETPVVAEGNRPWVKKVVSDSTAVHPDQVEELRAMNKLLGTPTEVLPNGQQVFESVQQMKDWARTRGWRHYGY